ncbi:MULTISPECIES: helix-turn-helix domain-containing protein [unclassified Pseudonocardia]|uniref:sigma-54-dependent Fis family transcriptional regulator n=1 Tax=unclassified Pseudonocardia TaxID=2619320 RepID=UPI0001FFDE0F|nr:helix-turn-helix domain-containing protein [Pseudonocardia sp. Ae707_Ps1]OLM08919.1 transcriptional regulator, Fis family [Pseudonocardia sp. Ae707_Ps1]
MDEWARAMHAARDVLGANPARMPETAGPVRAVVYESWKRSRVQGLRPDDVAPGYYPEVDLDSYLTRAVAPIVEKRRAALEQAECALSLTDNEGRLLHRWVPDPAFAARLDTLNVAPRFSVAESHVGTTSAITLLSGRPILVRGPEHFAEAFHDLSCAGAPIVHPITRRVVGSIDLTCRLGDTTPFVLSWVMEIAADIQDSLRHAASGRERLLLDSYLTHNRDTRHPLVTLDQHTIITNAAAARLIGGVDQAMLWEHAAKVLGDQIARPCPVTLTDGTRVSVETHPVNDGPDVIGAVLKLKAETTRPAGRSATEAFPRLPGLVGSSPRWAALCRRAAAIGSAERVLLVGEQGSGRLAVAASLAEAGPLRVADATELGTRGVDAWLADVETELDGPEETLVLRHIDRLDPDVAHATLRALERRPGSRRVFATSEAGPLAFGARNPLIDAFSEVLDVPPLRDRLEDLAVLLAALTKRVVGDGETVRWMPEAVQALSRLEWAGNVASLETLVRTLVVRNRGGYVGAADLPADVVARAARRPLAMLEQAEARTIMKALRDSGGNKHRAAESLGIARSTLYRKVRALGLDLSTAAF